MKVRLAAVSVLVILGTALPGHTGQLDDDLYRIAEARGAAPGAYQQAAADDIDYWTWYGLDYAPAHVNHVLCSVPTPTYGYQSPKDLSPAALIPAKDIVEVHGNCTSPYPELTFDIQLSYAVQRWTGSFYAHVWGDVSQAFPGAGGQGAAVAAAVHPYP